jgi:two-component system sensor histidine kinase NblS
MDRHHSQVNLVSEVGIGTTFWFDLEIFEEEILSTVEAMPETLEVHKL